MERICAVKNIMDSVTDEIIIASAGMISREVYATKDRPRNFYVQGSMGAALGIGIGVALNIKKNVIVIAGDGEVLMSLGTLVLMKKLNLPNLELIILDNNSYQSTGGQKTVSDAIDFRLLCYCKVIFCGDSKKDVPRIDIEHKEIKMRFMEAIK